MSCFYYVFIKRLSFPNILLIQPSMNLFKLRGKLTRSEDLLLGLLGFIIFIAIWWLAAESSSIQRPIIEGFNNRLPSSLNLDSEGPQINQDSLALAIALQDSIAFANATEFEKVYPVLPPPPAVLKSYPELFTKDNFPMEALRSIWLNVQGYFWAISISLLFGFIIGLYPLFRGLFSKQTNALRYLPLTALTGVFILWFGIEDEMKIAFLAFGIIVYLLPVVVQRIDEVRDVYLKTVFTLGATDWQTIRSVYIPAVMSKLMDDIRVLTAISWTYIIIAELLNRAGGVGSLIFIKARQGQLEKVFAILFIIILIGFVQDRIFMFIDRRLFPHKYVKTANVGYKESQFGIFAVLGITMLGLILSAMFPGFGVTLWWGVGLIVIAGLLFIGLGEYKIFIAEGGSVKDLLIFLLKRLIRFAR